MPPGVGLVDDAADLPARQRRRSPRRSRRHRRHRDACVRRPGRPLRGPRHRPAGLVARAPGPAAGLASWSPAAPAQVAGPPGCARRLGPARCAGLEIALRDLDDLAGNARRVVAAVDAARADGALDEDVPVHVELPRRRRRRTAWLAAADEVAARRAPAEVPHRRRSTPTPSRPPPTLAAWIDAALDREMPFKCTAGLHHAVRPPRPGDRLRAPRLPQRAARDPARLRRRRARRRGRGRSSSATPAALVAAAVDADLGRRAPLVHLVRLLLGRPSRSTTSIDPGARWRTMSTTHRPGSTAPPARSFDVDNLPYGVFSPPATSRRGSASGSATRCSTWRRSRRPRCSTCAHVFEAPSLNPLHGRWAAPAWTSVRRLAHRRCSPTRPSATSSSRTWCRSTR